jgi:hypothetical protein
VLPTDALLGPGHAGAKDGEGLDQELKSWLERLVALGEGALPNDQGVRQAFPSDLLRSVLGGRVVWEIVEECRRRAAAPGPRYTSEQVTAHLQALQEEWDRTGGCDEAHMRSLLERVRSEGRP